MKKLLILFIIPLLSFGQNENDTIYSLNQKIELENEINIIKDHLYLYQRQQTTGIGFQILGNIIIGWGIIAQNNTMTTVGAAFSIVGFASSFNAYGLLNIDGHSKTRNKKNKNKNDGFTPFLQRKGIIKNGNK